MHQGHLPTTFKNKGYSKDAPTNNSKTSLCISWIGWLLLKIYQKLCEDSKAINLTYKATSKV